MFVYMDGDYQCNRNRRSLKIPDGTTPKKDTEINFNVRQKEVMLVDGTFAAKEWRFENLNIGSEDAQKLGHEATHGADYLGMVEVVVLRCLPGSEQPDAGKLPGPQSRPSKTPTGSMPVGKNLKLATLLPQSDDSSASSETSGPFIGMFDGASDEAPRKDMIMLFGGDAGWDDSLPQTSKATQRVGASLTNPDASVNKSVNEGSISGSALGSAVYSQWHGRNTSPSHFKQDWSQSGRPSSQISHSQNSPQAQTQGKSGGITENEAANPSVSGSKPSAPRNSVTGEPVRSGSTVQGAPSVIINMDQADPTPGPWGVGSASPVVSELDSWVTRQSPRDHGEKIRQASQESGESRRPSTSWPAPAAWSEIRRGGQPSEDKKESAKGSSDDKSLLNPPPRNDFSIIGNKSSKGVSGNTVKAGTAGGGLPTRTTAATPDHSDILEHKKRGSWHSISPTGGMPGAWCTIDDEKASNTAGWSFNAAGGEQQVQSSSGRGNEGCEVAQKKLDRAQGPAVIDSSKQDWGAKKEAIPSGLGINGNSNTQSWSWSELKKLDTTGSQLEGKAGSRALEVKVKSSSETHVSKPQSSGEVAQSTGWELPLNKDQAKPSLFDKVRSKIGSPSPFKSATSSGEHDNHRSGMPGIRTSPGSGPFPTGKLSSPILLSQPSHQKQAIPDKQQPEQASVVGTEPRPLTPAEIYRKPYWSTKSNLSGRPQSTTGDGNFDTYLNPEDSLHTIPEEVVQRSFVSHQVHQGKPVVYTHKTAKPKYMDSHENPYAVFVFNYRSEEAVEKMLSIEVTEDEDEEKRRLHSLSKAELIEHFIRAKAKENRSRAGAAGAWQSISSPENGAGSASVTSPKGVNGLEAWTTKDNNDKSNPGIGIDLTGVSEGFAQLQTGPKNASETGSPEPDTLWGREAQKPGPSNVNAGNRNSKSKNNSTNSNGGNWTTSSGNNGNVQSGGGGGPTGSPQAQRNIPSAAGNDWSGSIAQEQKPSGGKWNAGNDNAGNNWGGGSNDKNNKNEDSNNGNNWGGGCTDKTNQNEDSNAGDNWGGGSNDRNNKKGDSNIGNKWSGGPNDKNNKNEEGNAGDNWGGGSNDRNNKKGDSNIGNKWGAGPNDKNNRIEEGNAGDNWGGGSPTRQSQNNKADGSGNDWGGNGGESKNFSGGVGGSGGGWAGGGGGSGWAGDDVKGSGGNGNKWGGSGQSGQGGDSQW